jgi:hypothetical protein
MGRKVQCPVCGNVFRALIPKVVLVEDDQSVIAAQEVPSPSAGGLDDTLTLSHPAVAPHQSDTLTVSPAGQFGMSDTDRLGASDSDAVGTSESVDSTAMEFEFADDDDLESESKERTRAFARLEEAHKKFIESSKMNSDRLRPLGRPTGDPDSHDTGEPEGWYVKHSWGEEGPLRGRDLQVLARKGQIHRHTKIRHSRKRGWFFAGKIPGLFKSKSAARKQMPSPSDSEKQRELQRTMAEMDHAMDEYENAEREIHSTGLAALADESEHDNSVPLASLADEDEVRRKRGF